MINRELLKRSIDKWGSDMQMNLAVEEAGEFVVAMSRYLRGRGSDKDVIEEIADTMIMMNQMALLFGDDLVAAVIEHKMARLEERLNSGSHYG